MTVLTEGLHTGEFALSECEESINRDVVTVTQSGAALKSGTVLGKITASGKYVPYNNGASDGSDTARAILWTALPAATGDKKAVALTRNVEVQGALLTGLDGPGTADLLALGIVVR